MKSLLIVLTVLCAVSSQAGVLSDSMTDSILESLLADKGYGEIDTYNPKDFNLGKRISVIKEANENINCEFKVAVSRRLAIDSMKKMASKEPADLMDTLLKKGSLKTAIVNQALVTADGSCNVVNMEIYSNDGEVLKIDYDFSK